MNADSYLALFYLRLSAFIGGQFGFSPSHGPTVHFP
jgi:hypothetical protein